MSLGDNLNDVRGINKCPPEIIDHIIQQLTDDGIPYLDWQLRACALVSRKWRWPAQRALHATVTLTPKHALSRLRLYVQRPEGRVFQRVSGGIAQHPRVLHLDWDVGTPVTDLTQTPEFTTFIQQSGPRIVELSTSHCWFDSFGEFVAFISLFPALVHLRLDHCTWGVQASAEAAGFQHDHDFGAPFPPLLQTIAISGGDEMVKGGRNDGEAPEERTMTTDLPLLYNWFAVRSSSKPVSVDVRGLHFSDATRVATDVILRQFGPQLTGVGIILDTLDSDLQGIHIDLSNNTTLEELALKPFVKGCIDRDFLAATLSSIHSPALRRINLGVVYSEDVEETPLESIGLDSAVRILSSQARFPALNHITIEIANSSSVYSPWYHALGTDMWCAFHQKVASLHQRNVRIEARYTLWHNRQPLRYDYDSEQYYDIQQMA